MVFNKSSIMLSLFTNVAYAVDCAVCTKIATNIINPIIGLMFGLAFVAFLYGVLEFIQGGANEKTLETGKRHMIYGILGIVIMIGARGIIELIQRLVISLGS